MSVTSRRFRGRRERQECGLQSQHTYNVPDVGFGPFVDFSGPSPPQLAENPPHRPKRCPTSNSLQRSLISRLARVRILPPKPTSKPDKALGRGTESSATSAPSGAPEDDVAQASGVDTVDCGGALTGQVMVRRLPSVRPPTNAGGLFG